MESAEKRTETVMSEHSLLSSDGKSRLHVVIWKPLKEIRGVLQISHGMIEHIRRYDEFARYMTRHGIAVIGHDHLGHGKTSRKEDYGFFAEKSGDVYMIRDIHRVRKAAERFFSGVPHILLGHSMGSYFLRKYLTIYGSGVDGAVIMGTGDQPLPILWVGKAAVGVIGRWKGWRHRSSFLHYMVLGDFDRKFKPIKTRDDWLSSDEKKVEEYVRDPMCNFLFTCQAYEDFFKTMLDLKRKFWLCRMPVDLPILLLSGKEDPVGARGRGVRRVYRKLCHLGIRDVSIHLYPNCRHELLNEKNREQVYHDILEWINQHI
ncbi:alpha/beta hydrolase [Lachnospiraceae bacterium 62-35]